MSGVLQQFSALFGAGHYSEACSELCTSLRACLSIATPSFLSKMISRGRNDVISTVFLVITSHNIDVADRFDPNDFMIACQYCDSEVIGILGNHPAFTFANNVPPRENAKQLNPALQMIIDRKDPLLLHESLTLVPALRTAEPKRTRPLTYILKQDYQILIDHLCFVIDGFGITNRELVFIARKYPNVRHPRFQIALDEAELSESLVFALPRCGPQESFGDDIFDVEYPHVMSNMERAHNFRLWLRDFSRQSEPYSVALRIDARSRYVLIQLPYALMTDDRLLLSPNISLTRALLGDEAIGEGPVNDMFDGYFRQLVKSSLFNGIQEESSRAMLPTCIETNNEPITIAYGLGIVLLKVLIDRRTITAANEGTEVAFVPHPWFFRALTGALFEADLETPPTNELFCESQIGDAGFYNMMQSYLGSEEAKGQSFRQSILMSKMHLSPRKKIFEAISNGFHLVFLERVTPWRAREPMARARARLESLFQEVERVGHESLRLLLVPPAIMSADFVFSRFVIEGYEHFASGPVDRDSVLLEQHRQALTDQVSIFEEVIRNMCEEPCQSKLRMFLKFVTGSPVLSTIQTDDETKWRLAIDFGLTSNVMYVHNCDRTIRIQPCKDPQELKRIIDRSLLEFFQDPVTRDVQSVPRASDFD